MSTSNGGSDESAQAPAANDEEPRASGQGSQAPQRPAARLRGVPAAWLRAARLVLAGVRGALDRITNGRRLTFEEEAWIATLELANRARKRKPRKKKTTAMRPQEAQ